jgi:predicted transcriptional regulator
MVGMIKCSKKDLLLFIKKRGMVENWEIVQKYNFSTDYVVNKLRRIQSQGLIKRYGNGHWVLTEVGIRRLKLYGED